MATAQRTRPSGSTSGRRGNPSKRDKDSHPRLTPPLFARADTWGVILVLVGVVAALGIWLDLTGPVGRWMADASGAVVGLARLLVPLAVVAVGVLLIRGKPSDGVPRIVVGLVLCLLAGCGLAHLVVGVPDGAPVDAVRGAGGWLGAGLAVPLRTALAAVGAALVLLVVAIAGLLVLTATPVRTAAAHSATAGARTAGVLAAGGRRAGAGARTAGGALARTWDRITTLADQPPDDAEIADGPEWHEDEAPDAGASAPERDADTTEPAPDPDRTRTIAAARPVEVGGEPTQLAIDLGPGVEPGQWALPSLALLKRTPVQEVDLREVEEAGRALERSLAAHGVETTLVGMTVGPTVTRYELELGEGVKVARVTSLNKDIAYAMASPDVRILAPIPGRSAIGVEVPNKTRQLVAVGDILASEEAHKARHPLEVAIGRDISGRAVLANLAEMPHVLIAGATGAGKSSCINSLLTSLLVRSTPEQVRLILIDPKRVELGQYNGLPHLLTGVVVNPKKAANALAWAVKEMERRSDLLSEVGVRDITAYNAAFDRGDLRTEGRAEGVADPGEPVYERLPYVVVVVDELNDLMMVAARDVEESICRVAQMGRAFGIHLVLATQRPSVNVITGVIKANIPARLAFAVSSLADSRVILDQQGAERLVGRGDMLLLGPASSVARRIQGAWVGEDEVRKVVAHWRRQVTEVTAVAEVTGEDAGQLDIAEGPPPGDEDDDDLLWSAMELIVRSQLGSTSMLQRKLRVGFARAGRLMDLLEQRGVVGPSTGSKARDVLMTVEELEELTAAHR